MKTLNNSFAIKTFDILLVNCSVKKKLIKIIAGGETVSRFGKMMIIICCRTGANGSWIKQCSGNANGNA